MTWVSWIRDSSPPTCIYSMPGSSHWSLPSTSPTTASTCWRKSSSCQFLPSCRNRTDWSESIQWFIPSSGRMCSSKSSHFHNGKAISIICASSPFQPTRLQLNPRNSRNISTAWRRWRRTKNCSLWWSNCPTSSTALKPSGIPSRSFWKVRKICPVWGWESGRRRQCLRWVCMNPPTHTDQIPQPSLLPGSTSTSYQTSLKKFQNIAESNFTTIGRALLTKKTKELSSWSKSPLILI